MEQKRLNLYMDGYAANGAKAMDVHGPFGFAELKDEMLRALAHDLIPVVRLLKPRGEQAPEEPEEDSELLRAVEESGTLYVRWSYKGVEFEAEGPAEFVLRASKEMMAVLEVVAK